MQRSAPVDPVSAPMPASRWPLWLIAAVALAALATSLALILRPALPLTVLLGGLAVASAIIAGAALRQVHEDRSPGPGRK